MILIVSGSDGLGHNYCNAYRVQIELDHCSVRHDIYYMSVAALSVLFMDTQVMNSLLYENTKYLKPRPLVKNGKICFLFLCLFSCNALSRTFQDSFEVRNIVGIMIIYIDYI